MLVRKLLVAYIMKIGSLKRLKSNIWLNILVSALKQQILDFSVSAFDKTSSLQFTIEALNLAGSFLRKHRFRY